MLYIFDQNENLIALLKPDFNRSTGPATTSQAFLSAAFPSEFDREPTEGCPYWDAVHREVLNGENTFTFTVPADRADAAYVVESNLVAFKDLDSYWQVFEIKRLVDAHGDGLTRTVHCEHISYELLDDIVTDKRPSADATAALAGMLEGTRWQAGIVDDLGAASTSAYYISALEAVQKVTEAWQGELNWRCVVAGGVITRYVDLRAMVGTDTGKQFVYSKDILSIEREVDSSGVVTALYGRGKGVELDSGSYGRRLTFADIEAADKPRGQEWVGDNAALAQWGRGGRHRFDVFTDEEETDPAALLEKTRVELARRKDPRVTYRLDVVSLEQLAEYEHEQVRLGDLVRVIDREFKPELVVSARVVDIERDLLVPENTRVVLGSFAPMIVDATINNQRRVEGLANKPYNTKWLDGVIDVLQNAIENKQAYIWETPQGTLHMNAPSYEQATEAMLLGGGRFAIASQKDGQGGWTWRSFGDGSGFTGDLINAGLVRAEFIQVGSATTFDAGYDPTRGSVGVDADCVGLWHFDGSLNSHKGVSAIGDENFDTGCFGQAVMVEAQNTNLLTENQSSIETDTTGFEAISSGIISKDTTEHYQGSASLRVQGSAQFDGVKLSTVSAVTAGKCTFSVYLKGSGEVRIRISNNGAVSKTVSLTSAWKRYSVTKDCSSAVIDMLIQQNNSSPMDIYCDGLQLEASLSPTTWQLGGASRSGTGIIKIPTTDMSVNEGAISFRAKNLSESGKGAVLIDLPKSDDTQGILVGINTADACIYITDSTTTVYGPNKSTLTGWDSISLAYKSDRLSLVVNDTEACYIENPGLPTAFGSCLYIGTDRNGNNAINTLVDELRIDKVYRDATTRIAWHKAGVPFYTSEDMKQWPGYLRAETDGLKVYDSQDQLRVLLGSWLKDAVRKYGLKIIGGEIYSAFISTRDPNDTSPNKARAEIDTNGNITIYDNGGQKGMVMSGLSGQGSVNWFYGGEQYAQAFVNAGAPKDFMIWTLKDESGINLSPSGQVTGLRLGSTSSGGDVELKGKNTDIKGTQQINLATGNNGWVSLNAGSGGIVQISGSTTVYGNLSATGSKPAQQVTENYGLRYLYATEAPGVIYYDRGIAYLENGEVTIYLDPIYLECIEPDADLTPWQIWVQCYGENDVYISEIGENYFRIKERNSGTSNNKVVWKHEAIRSGYAGIRLMEVVD